MIDLDNYEAVLMRIEAALVAFLSVTLSAPAAAGPFEDGIAAYRKGDYETALELWRPVAEQGDASAQTNLGFMYDFSEGVPEDDAAAVMWYRKAADQGLADAQFLLATMYVEGKGVARDYVQAHMWFNLAAAQGKVLARENRDIIARRMAPEPIAKAQKMAREWVPMTYVKAD